MNRDEAHALIARQARAWEGADVEAILADFAPDCLFIAPGGRWQGLQALRAAAEAAFAAVTAVQIAVTRVLLDGEQGALEWTWSETSRADGRSHTVEDGIIFALRAGKIIYWREYFDTAHLR